MMILKMYRHGSKLIYLNLGIVEIKFSMLDTKVSLHNNFYEHFPN